uniref:Putative Nucleotide-binding, alpha-beta plait n=2 Tax=Davidia involucrata TaxID=16924 RepID=A0A5B7BM64_DAVIN
MADNPTSSATAEPNSQSPDPENPVPQSNQADPSPPSSSSSPSTSVPVNPNPTLPPSIISPPQPPSIQPYAPPQISTVPPTAPPSFRPVAPPVPVPTAPQFSPLPNPNFQNSTFQNPSVQPPGVSPLPVMIPGTMSGARSVVVSMPLMMPPYGPPGQPPNSALRPYALMPNGFPTMPAPAPQGTIPPPGIPRYPSPYVTMVRPAFHPRPPGAIGMFPAVARPPGIRSPFILPVVRPAVVPSVTPTEKPQTTVYVGKIASTLQNDFMLSILQLCGSVKNWKRAQDPTDGTPKGFGFCEFDSAEGVLRALRLLSKLNVDGQELVLNVNQATREFLERYVEKKKENSKKLKATEPEGAEKEEESAPGDENNEPPKPSVEDSKKDDIDLENKENHDIANFGMVTDEDREADREALEKLTGMIEERLKTNPLPPPPPQTAADGSGNSNLELPAKSKDGDSDVDIIRNDAAEDKNDDEMTSDSKPTSEHDRPEINSPDKSRRYDRRSRDRERDLKRGKERELERYEREREQERARRERDRDLKIRDDERRYKVLVKEWESYERDKERKRKLEKERDKEREYKRRREIMDQEHDSDDGDTRKRKHKSSGSEERRRRLKEKEEDLTDRLKEEEEIAEAKRRADEEQRQQEQQEKDSLILISGRVTNGSDEAVLRDENDVESKDKAVEQTSDGDSGYENHIGDGILQNGTGDAAVMGSPTAPDTQQSSNAPARKLGFGLVGSGKRTAVPSVFHEEDEDAHKEKKMRPLVPIDYSTEELQAVQPTVSGAPSPNLVAAAEFAKRISNVTPREERSDAEKERSRRSHDRYGQRDRDRNDEETNRIRDDNRKGRDREHGLDKVKTSENQKLLDAKQLIDMIPKTKEELFSYEINWAIYDKNELQDRMRPWISKKITEFLGEEETSLVDYIVSATREHVKASEMLERLQSIFDDEAEMLVLKMWRMLIFEIKKIETGLAFRSKT